MWFVLDESILAVIQLLDIFKIHLYRLFHYLVQYLPDWFIISWSLLSISLKQEIMLSLAQFPGEPQIVAITLALCISNCLGTLNSSEYSPTCSPTW